MSDFVKNADENIMNFKDRLRFPANFDMLDREVRIGRKEGRFFLYRWFCSGGYGGKTYAVFLFLKTGRCQ